MVAVGFMQASGTKLVHVPVAQMILKISASYSPPPPEGFVSPMGWGVPSNVIERFGATGIAREAITCWCSC